MLDKVKKIIAEELQALEDKNGVLRPDDVINAARNPESAMHSHFTWDIGEAAEKCWREEAGTLIRTVKVPVEYGEIEFIVPRYVRDTESAPNESGYRNIVSVQSSKKRMADTLGLEMSRVDGAAERAMGYAAAFHAEAAIKEIRDLVNLVKTKIAETLEAGE